MRVLLIGVAVRAGSAAKHLVDVLETHLNLELGLLDVGAGLQVGQTGVAVEDLAGLGVLDRVLVAGQDVLGPVASSSILLDRSTTEPWLTVVRLRYLRSPWK